MEMGLAVAGIAQASMVVITKMRVGFKLVSSYSGGLIEWREIEATRIVPAASNAGRGRQAAA